MSARPALGISAALAISFIGLSPTAAQWAGLSDPTQLGAAVSSGHDISGYVGWMSGTHVSQELLEAQFGNYVSRNSGHSFGPATGLTDTGSSTNSITVEWRSDDANDPVQNGVWNVLAANWRNGVSAVTGGATYHGEYTHTLGSIIVLQFSSGGTTDFSPDYNQVTIQGSLTNNDSWTTTQPPELPQDAIGTGTVGMAPGFSPALRVTAEITTSLLHTWSHPPGQSSSASVLANPYLRLSVSIARED